MIKVWGGSEGVDGMMILLESAEPEEMKQKSKTNKESVVVVVAAI